MYETINDYQTQQEVKAHTTLSPQQQEFLWKVQHGRHGERARDDSSYQDMSSATDGVRITTGFAYPPFAANQNPGTTSTGNPYFQQPCPAAAASSSGPRPVLDHITVTGQLSPTMVVIQGGTGEILAIEDDDQEYTVMSQAGTLTSQNSSMTAAQQGQNSSGADGNVTLPMYSVVDKGEPSKPQKVMVTEC